MKEKKQKVCKVCSLFDDKKFNEEIRFNINKLIKLKQPTEILNKETGFNLTDYYYKKHNDICIVDFLIPIEEREIELTKSNEIDIKNIEEFDNLKFIEKHNKKQEILNRISYKLLLKIDNDKYISKEEVSTLKTLNDLINQNYIEIIDSIDNLKNIDKFGFNLFKTISSYKSYTIDQSIDIIKLIPSGLTHFSVKNNK